jgi:preprotein translocase subunit SecF
MEFFHKVSTVRFMQTRRVWYVVSGVMIVLALVSLSTRGLNLGVEFTGGKTVQARFVAAADVDAVGKAMTAGGYADSVVTVFGTSREVLIRLPPQRKESTTQFRDHATAVLRGLDPKVEILQIETVEAQVGKELQNSAMLSLGITMALILLYVAVRFHTFRLGLGAIIAALHDPIIVAGFFSETQLVFDLPTVSALLAVIGYSLNDTVVVFDRIRERFLAARRLAPEEVLNQSVNQTLSRTIITSGATFIVVVVLLLIGGPVLKGFSAALTVGIIVGTYSSIYIASAIALDLGLKAEHLLPTAVKKPLDDLP